MEYIGSELSEGIFHYKFVAILLLFRFGYILFSRKRFKFIKGRVPRSSSDATWFLPVFIWGIESLGHLIWYCKSMGIQPDNINYWFLEDGFFSISILIIVIGLCYLQEYLARRIRAGVRAGQATVPLGVMASIFAVLVLWMFFYIIIRR